MNTFLSPKKSYFFIFLMAGIILGAISGVIFGKDIIVIKPFADIFLHLLMTTITPLVFFSIASVLSVTTNLSKLFKIIFSMLVIFLVTGAIATVLMLSIILIFKPNITIPIELHQHFTLAKTNFSKQILMAFMTDNFYQLLDKRHMLALIVFSILTGVAVSAVGEKAKSFAEFLLAGKEVMFKIINFIMYYAPVGLGVYFACLIGVYGTKFISSYIHIIGLYYPTAILYFLVAFTIYAYFGDGWSGIKRFWQHSPTPIMISFLTGSSNATIPANLNATKAMGIPKEIREIVIPFGATLHMDGSCLAAVLKIATLFSIYHVQLSGLNTLATIFGITLLSSIVMSGITEGGFVSETLIITLFGFPIAGLPVIIMIGILVDPPATMINSVGDSVASMLITRWVRSAKHSMSKE